MCKKLYEYAIRAALCALAALFTLCSPLALADADMGEDSAAAIADAGVTISPDVKAALLLDAATGQLLLEKDGTQKLPVATLPRLMSALVLCEAVDTGALSLEDKLIVSDNASRIKGQTAFLQSGEEISVKSTLKSAIMLGAGDSYMALAEKLTGADEAFAQAMTKRAAEFGVSAQFTSAAESALELSASDLSAIALALCKTKSFLGLSGTYMEDLAHEDGRMTELVNPNRLVRFYSGCDGMGTSSSGETGYHGVFTAKRGELRLICVIIGAKNSATRQTQAQQMLDFGFASYKSIALTKAGETIEKISVTGGKQTSVPAVTANETKLLLKKGEDKNLEKALDLPQTLAAPLMKGDKLGELIYMQNGAEVARIPLVAGEDVPLAGYIDSLLNILRNWLRA